MKFRILASGAGCAALCFASFAWAQASGTIADPAAVFGARPSVEDISMSPDGTKVAYIVPRSGQGAAVYVASVAGGEPQPVTSVNGDPERLLGCDWVANDRLACMVYAMVQSDEIAPVSRTVAFDLNGGNVKVLKQSDSMDSRYANLYGGGLLDLLPGEDGAVLMDRWFVPEAAFKTRIADDREGYGVVRVDTRTLATKTVEQPERYGAEFLTDGRGNVRIMGVQLPKGSGYAGQSIRYSYRTSDSRRWNALGEYDVLTEEGVNPVAIDPALNALYALKKLTGRKALFRIALDGSLREEKVFAHPQVDVEGVARIGRSRRPVGVRYTTEKRQVEYFDPELKRLAASLGKSLPNLPLVHFADASADESKLLVWAGSDTDPGRYYVFDKAKRQLNEIMLVRPALENAALAPMRAVTYKAADGTSVPAYLTLPRGGAKSGLPAIVMPHGGPGSRDDWGFDWLVQYFAARGFAVLQPNFRGSAGYGDAWFQNNGFQSWKTAIGDVNDAGRWLVAQGIANPSKLAVVGWSYGGYAALQSAVVDPSLYKAVVAIAPVTDLNMLKEESRNWSNFSIVNKYVGSGPHIREGSPAQNADRIGVPVLLFHGDMDRNVLVSQSRVMESRLRGAGKKVQLVVYPKRDHGLSDTQVRTDMLRKSDAFLRSAMGM